MSLSTAAVRATVGVSDLARAREFYGTVLGLKGVENGPITMYTCGGGSLLQVYESADLTPSTASAASWSVDDFDDVVDGILGRGGSFERYDFLDSDDRGVHTFGVHQVCWLKDPDGNVLAIDNGQSEDYS